MTDHSAQWARYAEEGYAVFPRVLDPSTVRNASDHVEWLMERHPNTRPEHFHSHLMYDDPFWVGLVADERLLDLVEGIIGPNIALFASHYICKPGGDGLPVAWHQDGSYWPLEPMEVVTAWLAVDASTAENGCMRVVPGSHKGTILPHKTVETRAVLPQGLDLTPEEEDRAVDIELPPGGVSLHHPLLVHGSAPNFSPKRRCGLTIRYIPATTRITDQKKRKTFPLRGEPVPGVNEYAPFPRYREGEHFRPKDAHPNPRPNSAG
jgi:ectoine hydroxylase-related dioxygenase (phytanoyl-CoA dioxygenase family)